MKKLDCQAVLRSYVDPLRKEAGEWGAFTGLHGADRAVGLEQIRMLSGTALARAGFSVSTRLNSARARLASIESNQNGMREELQAAWRKLIGSQPFDCTRMHRVIVEAVLEMFAIPGLIMALLASKPFMAWRRRRLERIERDDGNVDRAASSRGRSTDRRIRVALFEGARGAQAPRGPGASRADRRRESKGGSP